MNTFETRHYPTMWDDMDFLLRVMTALQKPVLCKNNSYLPRKRSEFIRVNVNQECGRRQSLHCFDMALIAQEGKKAVYIR